MREEGCPGQYMRNFLEDGDARAGAERRTGEMAHEQNPEMVMSQVKAELANAYAQEFFTTVRDKCFQKCVTKPSSTMSSSEAQCLGKCTDRYVEATKMISHVVLQAYSKGAGGM